jgi:hypothetical protein
VALEHRAQAPADVAQRLLPRHTLEAFGAGPPAHRVHDAVGVILHLGHRDALGAGVAPRQRVLAVGPQARDAAVVHGRDQAAVGFADPAEGDAVVRHRTRD